MPKARFAITSSTGRVSGTTAVITGAKELDALLAALPKKVANKILRDALRKGAEVVKEAAKARAPVRTGLLQRSITVRKGKRKRKGGGQSVVIFPDIAKFGRKNQDFYAPYVEYGTSHSEAEPYMRTAFAATKDRVMAGIQSDIMAGVLSAKVKK